MGKITIDTIKSEDARFQIENYTTNGRMLSKAAISAVVKAERQAEERAVKAYAASLEHWIVEEERAAMIAKFKQLLNEMQSDE